LGRGDFEGFETEALNAGENVVGGLGPDERLGLCIDGVDVAGDRRLEFFGGAMRVSADLLAGEVGDEALD